MTLEIVNPEVFSTLKAYIPKAVSLVVTILIIILLYKLSTYIVRKTLLIRAKTKRHKDNVIVFMHLIRYISIILAILVIIFVSTGSFTGLGISAGLLTAALGWALQRPITGIAAWIMVVVRKPFQIGDRVMIGDLKGDVSDLSLTHISLKEIGGTVNAEESSGRTILVPNSILFEQKIINYTLQDDYILDEVITLLTYESNLPKAKQICLDAAVKHTKNIARKVSHEPNVRIKQSDSGIQIKTRYFVKATDRINILSKIHEDIITSMKKTKGVQIAYPHLEMVYRKK